MAVANSVGMSVIDRLTGLYGMAGSIGGDLAFLFKTRFVSDAVYYAPVAALYHAAAYARTLRMARDRLRREQSDKTELVRGLAGGIAHEVNNALTVTISSADLALEVLDAHPASTTCGPPGTRPRDFCR